MRLGGNVYIAREPEAVFDAVADHWIDFGPRHGKKIEPMTEGPLGVGSKFLLWKGDVPLGTQTYTVWDPPHRLVRDTEMSGLAAWDETRLQPYEGGTLVEFRFQVKNVDWRLRPFLLIGLRGARRDLLKGLEQMKTHLEESG